MTQSISSRLLAELNSWYDNLDSEEQLFYADARSDLEEKLHILEALDGAQRIDHMLALSNFMHRALFKPDESARRAHNAAVHLMDSYIKEVCPDQQRVLSLSGSNPPKWAREWARLIEHYDGQNIQNFIGSTAVYYRKSIEKFGESEAVGAVQEYANSFSDQLGLRLKREAKADLLEVPR